MSRFFFFKYPLSPGVANFSLVGVSILVIKYTPVEVTYYHMEIFGTFYLPK